MSGAQTLSQDQPQTKEEKDIISQSKKKLKRRSNGEPISIPAPTQVDDVIMADFTFQQTYTPAPVWGSRFFKETVEQGKAKPHIYDGADEEDELDAFVVEDMERGSEGTLSGQNSIYPKVLIPLSERKDLWKPWRRALIARKIGGIQKTGPRYKRPVENGFEMLDLDLGSIC